MRHLIAQTCADTFVVLAAWHFYWALGGRVGLAAAVPQVRGRPAFKPRRWMTAAVGIALLGCAALLCGLGGMPGASGQPGLQRGWLVVPGYLLAIALLLRGLGDGRRVGLLKGRAGPDAFARLDTWIYSPLCLALALGTAVVTASAS